MPLRCKNYRICRRTNERHLKGHNGHLLCSDCHFRYCASENSKGYLCTQLRQECPICLTSRKVVCLPNCTHHICSPCFRKCFYGDEEILKNEPSPSDDIIEWIVWNLEYNCWREDTAHLRRCPMCRA